MKSDLVFERLLRSWPAKVLSIAVAIFLFLFYRMATLEERFISVPLEIELSEELIPAQAVPENVRLTIRGRSQDVNLILPEDLKARVDFTAYEEEGRYSAPIRIEKRGAALHADPVDIKVEPVSLTLRFERRLRKSVQVKPNITGFPAKGFEMGQYFLTPSRVEVEGVRSTVENLTEVTTEDIDIGGKTEDFTVRVRLERPGEGVFFPGGDVVEFYGVIQETMVLQTLHDVDVIALDLDPKLQIQGEIASTTLRIQGKQLLLEGLQPGDIRFTIDCSSIRRPGTYLLPLVPDLPQGVLVLRFEPTEVRVEIRMQEDGDL